MARAHVLMVLLLAASLASQESRPWPAPWLDPTPPEVRVAADAPTELDRFVVHELDQRGLRPAPRADRRTLLRRACFVLTGLPPTPAEQEAFFADLAPEAEALARLVDRLLATRAFGERFGRHWLDLARYADTAGDSSDFPVPDAWRYRNWVINSFARDLPYDQFLRAQVAGDVLAESAAPEEREALTVATGFLALARRFGVGPRQDAHLIIEDCIDTLGRSVLGVTLRCARCHDHKFDPISMADYYGLYGILQSSRFPFPGSEDRKRPEDLTPLVPRADAERLQKAWDSRLAELEAGFQAAQRATAAADQALKDETQGKEPGRWFRKSRAQLQAELTAARAAETAARQAREAHAATRPFPAAYAMAEGTPADARIQKAGNPRQGQEPAVPRRFPRALAGEAAPAIPRGSGRRELADWLTAPEHPLTARVMANRLWLWTTGAALVRTPGNFGSQGQQATHPELLDWLARRFVASGWSVKATLRTILASRTWQQASVVDNPTAHAADPDARLLWRAQRRRLDAETLRDSILAASGALDQSPGEAQPFPPISQWSFSQHYPFRAVYETRKRSVYLMTQRIQPHPFLALFDGPDTNAAQDQREHTTTPSQMLFLLNDEWVHQQADLMARRVCANAGEERARVELLYRLVLVRVPDGAEQEAAADFLARCAAALPAPGAGADANVRDGEIPAWSALCRSMLASNEFLHVD